MNIADFIILLLVLVVSIYGFFKGFLSFLAKFLAIVFTILLISKFGIVIKEIILSYFPIKPITAAFIGYTVVFIIITIIFQLIYKYIKKFISALDLNIYDRIFGGIVSILILFVSLIALILVLQKFFPVTFYTQQILSESLIISTLFRIIESELPFLNRYF